MPTVLITGANRGIGFEFVRQYAAAQWTVIACCRAPLKAEALQALAKPYSSVRIEALDVADSKAISTLATKLKEEAIDVLVNNAGILSGSAADSTALSGDTTQSFGSIDPAGWEKVMKVNVLAPLKMSEAFLPHLRKGNQRKLVMISSGWGSIASMDGDFYAYKLSKAALNAAAKNLAADLRDEKICVVAMSPGWVKTDMGSQEAEITPEMSVKDMRRTIEGLALKQSGQFMKRDGTVTAW